jgi:uncharacterized integral membrane protein
MKAKLITLIALFILLFIFIVQNTAEVPVKFLFWTFTMSAIILISLTGLVGVILGYVLARVFEAEKISSISNTE